MIKFIIFSSCFGLVFSLYSGFMQWVKSVLKVKRFKPLDCEGCMSFWACLISATTQGYSWFNAIGMAFTSYILTLLIRSYVRPPGF